MYKEDAYCLCKLFMNRSVKVETREGHSYEGTIVHVDTEHLYLQVRGGPTEGADPTMRPLFPPAGYYNPSNQIMTLALFDLLVIALALI